MLGILNEATFSPKTLKISNSLPCEGKRFRLSCLKKSNRKILVTHALVTWEGLEGFLVYDLGSNLISDLYLVSFQKVFIHFPV